MNESVATSEVTVDFLRVLKGRPTDEEIAVLVALVAARMGAARDADVAAEAAEGGHEWNGPHRLVRRIRRRGPGSWRAQAWPG
ncbi:MAG: acyl-CoA carboxylase subunit epsilon [Nocardioidaceae bacterium]